MLNIAAYETKLISFQPNGISLSSPEMSVRNFLPRTHHPKWPGDHVIPDGCGEKVIPSTNNGGFVDGLHQMAVLSIK